MWFNRDSGYFNLYSTFFHWLNLEFNYTTTLRVNNNQEMTYTLGWEHGNTFGVPHASVLGSECGEGCTNVIPQGGGDKLICLNPTFSFTPISYFHFWLLCPTPFLPAYQNNIFKTKSSGCNSCGVMMIKP